ncbi:MAG: hypothetical protein RLY31_1744 [Bacteroidota bacterium]|jgi:hypothetical protein
MLAQEASLVILYGLNCPTGRPRSHRQLVNSASSHRA